MCRENSETNVRKMTCIVCPIGCRMDVEVSPNGSVKSVTGNTCARGKTYAVSETENPVRTLTTTVKLANSKEPMLPVKTSSPIPKSKLFDAMNEIREITVYAPVKSGDVIKKDFIAPNVNLIATKSINIT